MGTLRMVRRSLGKALAGVVLAALSCLLLPPGTARADLPVRAAILLNMTTGRILYQKNPDMRIPPASLTKVMTSYLVHDAIRRGRLSMGSKVRITSDSTRAGGSTMHLMRGEKVTVNELLQGMLITSGNDAATALALKVSGNVRKFVGAMNAKASAIGMRSTVFKNPTGLPAAGQMTTARDMMRLSLAYLSNNPQALRIHSQSFFQHRRRTLCTTNPFLGERGVDGLKTGFTASSGYNIIVTGKRNGTRLLAVVLGGRTSNQRNRAARELLDAGFASSGNAALVRAQIDGKKRILHRHGKKAGAVRHKRLTRKTRRSR